MAGRKVNPSSNASKKRLIDEIRRELSSFSYPEKRKQIKYIDEGWLENFRDQLMERKKFYENDKKYPEPPTTVDPFRVLHTMIEEYERKKKSEEIAKILPEIMPTIVSRLINIILS